MRQAPLRVADPETPAAAAAPADATDGATARAAGRGGLAVAGAKVWFIVVGLVQQTLLPRLVGLEGYGAFALAQSVANIPNNVVVTASIQGMSRAVADAGADGEQAAQRRGLRVHAVLAPVLAGAFFAGAPAIAAFEHAPHVVAPLRVLALVLLAYGLYAPLVGSLNGRRRFGTQAALDVTAATLRTVGLLAGGWALARSGHGVVGAAAGMALAAAAMVPIAARVAGVGRAGAAGPTPARHLGVLASLATAQLFLNLLMQVDIWVLRRFAAEAAGAAGRVGDVLQADTDRLVGAYRAAQLFAFLPYQLLVSITFILFPMLARARADHDDAAVASYVRAGMRIGLVLAGLMVACTEGLGPHLLRFAFPPPAADLAGGALRTLALGQGAFALFGIEAAVLASLSRERWSAAVTAGAAATVVALCATFVPGTPFGPALLERTATATAVALGSAAVLGAVLVRRAAGAFAPAATIVRVLVALRVAVAVGERLPWRGRLVLPFEALAVVAVYVALLVVTREIGRSDLDAVRRVVARKPAG